MERMIFLFRSLTRVNTPRAMTLRWMRENQFSRLVEPRRAGGRVMHPHVRVGLHERAHPFGFVAADVVADDMDLAARGLGVLDLLEEGRPCSAYARVHRVMKPSLQASLPRMSTRRSPAAHSRMQRARRTTAAAP